MAWYLWIIIGVLAAALVLIAVVLIRTAAFRPEKSVFPPPMPVVCDREKAIADLADMIRCKTVSDVNPENEDAAEFDKFEKLLAERFPAVYGGCELISPAPRTVLLRWRGKDGGACRVLMAHYDVVAAEQSLWRKPAFDGIIEDGELWGRGTLDTKVTLNGVMQAAEQLIKSGFVPQNDIYIAFSGSEEINGDGAPSIVRYFKEKNIRPALVCDEGGAVVEKVFPGVKERCALIGIAEKGLMNVRFSVEGKGGHASAPPAHTAVGKLGVACVRVENKPFRSRVTAPVKQLFDELGRRSTFFYRMIFANLWLFGGLLDKICIKSGGELNALMRTTVAFTQMNGSKGMNVLPPKADMVANLRIMCGETVQSAVSYLKKTVRDDDISVDVIYGMNPSRVSRAEGKEWDFLKNAILQTWGNILVSPYLMLACSDSRHYGEISDCVYRFSAMELTKEERGRIHGNDERIPLSKIVQTVEFYIRLISRF